MYDLAWFRANFDRIAPRLQTRSNPPNLDGYRELDKRRRAAIAESEQLKARRNAETVEIGKLRREGIDTAERQQQGRAIGERDAGLGGGGKGGRSVLSRDAHRDSERAARIRARWDQRGGQRRNPAGGRAAPFRLRA